MGPVERDVEFGIERFAADRKVDVPLRDALFVYKALGEFIAFFHQPDHWRTLADVQRFIGTFQEGGLHVLQDAYYRRLRDIWPADVEKALEDGLLDRHALASRPR